jgi:hypothetical protein
MQSSKWWSANSYNHQAYISGEPGVSGAIPKSTKKVSPIVFTSQYSVKALLASWLFLWDDRR